jgi:hypothetical protein
MLSIGGMEDESFEIELTHVAKLGPET